MYFDLSHRVQLPSNIVMKHRSLSKEKYFHEKIERRVNGPKLTCSAPQFPADETLQCWIAVIDQSSAAWTTELQCFAEIQRLSVIECIAFSIIWCRGAWRLVSKHWATFNGQRLIGIHKCFANRQRTWCVNFKMNTDKCARHRWIAWQEKWLAFFQYACESVTNWIRTQIGAIISNTYNYGCWLIVTYYWREMQKQKRREREKKKCKLEKNMPI